VAQVPDLDYLHDSSLSKEMQVNLIAWYDDLKLDQTSPLDLFNNAQNRQFF